jgi:hypothetical protein
VLSNRLDVCAGAATRGTTRRADERVINRDAGRNIAHKGTINKKRNEMNVVVSSEAVGLKMYTPKLISKRKACRGCRGSVPGDL